MRWKNMHIQLIQRGPASAEALVMQWLGQGMRCEQLPASRGPSVITPAGGTVKKHTVKCKHQATVLSTKLTLNAYSADCHLQIYK